MSKFLSCEQHMTRVVCTTRIAGGEASEAARRSAYPAAQTLEGGGVEGGGSGTDSFGFTHPYFAETNCASTYHHHPNCELGWRPFAYLIPLKHGARPKNFFPPPPPKETLAGSRQSKPCCPYQTPPTSEI